MNKPKPTWIEYRTYCIYLRIIPQTLWEATNRVQRPFLARKVCVWKHRRPQRDPYIQRPHVQRQRENCRSSEEAWDPWMRGWKELPVKTHGDNEGFAEGFIYIYSFIYTIHMTCITNTIQIHICFKITR